MPRVFTHKGTVVGCDSRLPPDWKQPRHLYATARWWCDEFGGRWNKVSGYPVPRQKFPLRRLVLETVEEL